MAAPAALTFLDAISPRSVLEDRKSVAEQATDELQIARREADHIRSAARTEGYASGIAAAHAELRPLIERLAELYAESEEKLAEREEMVARQAIELAMQTAALAVNRQLEIDPSLVVDAAQAALSRVREAGQLRLHVNPDSLAHLEPSLEGLAEIAGPLTVIGDPSVEAGGVRLICPDGEYAAEPSEQLARLQEAVARTLTEEL